MKLILQSLSKNKFILKLNRPINGVLFLLLHVLMNVPSQFLRHWVLVFFGMKIDWSSIIYMSCEIRGPYNIEVGKNTTIGHKTVLDGRGGLKIGDSVNISSEVMIWTAQHDVQSQDFAPVKGSVIVEDFAWLCSRCIVLPGVTIGKGAVVAAGAVVTKSVEPYTVVAGVPAKYVGKRNEQLNYELGRNTAIWFV
jgi:acetyltransferase-like isoleucine patch superfamily enzyme